MREGKVILTVTKQKAIATFDNPKGNGQSTLYEVSALDENGQVVAEPLRTFAELSLGKAVEYDVEKYVHDRHGTSWTLKKPRENIGRRVEALEEQAQDFANRLSALEGRKDGSSTAVL